MRPLKKTKRIAPADAGAFFEEAEKPCASGKIFCVKNGGSACYFGAAVLIYKYHSNVPGRVVCFGKAGKVFWFYFQPDIYCSNWLLVIPATLINSILFAYSNL